MKLSYKISAIGLGLWFVAFMAGTFTRSSTPDGGVNIGTILTIGSWAFFVVGMIAMIGASAGAAHAVALGVFLAVIGLGVYGLFSDSFAAQAPLLFVVGTIGYVGWIVWYSVLRGQFANAKIAKTGVKASGTLNSFERTGTSIRVSGQFPRYGVVLGYKATLPDRRDVQTFVRTSLTETEIGSLAIGTVTGLLIDPLTPGQAVLDPSAATATRNSARSFQHAPGVASEPQAASVVPVQVSAEEILARGIRGSAVIIQSTAIPNQKTPDGRYVFMLALDVTIADRPSFQVRSMYAISQDHLRFAVAGATVPVAVSPENQALVAVDWAALS